MEEDIKNEKGINGIGIYFRQKRIYGKFRAGCGGLTEGFLQTGLYSTLALVEWEKWPIETIKNRLETKYEYNDINNIALRYDIQDVWGLMKGWENERYGKCEGLDFIEYGVPQNRKRVIIVGLCKDVYGEKAEKKLQKFYSETLPKYKENIMTVQDAIADLPKLYPIVAGGQDNQNTRGVYTQNINRNIKNHKARYHNSRDIEIFRILTKDIETGSNKYISTDALKKLYTEYTGKKSNVHKYNVLRWDEPSNTIPAHLYKDGLRHIHPDSKQARSITVREAARLQTFPDDFEFVSNTNHDYKMIGNAVPPKFAKKLALAIKEDFY